MAAPKGNHNSVGNKGGGRSKAGEVQRLLDLWEGRIKFEDIKYKTVDGQQVFASGFDVYIYKVLTGDNQMLRNIVDKLYADKKFIEQEFRNSGDFGRDHLKDLTNEELRELIDELN